MAHEPHYLELAKKLDLEAFLELFTSLLSRPKPPYIEGDLYQHWPFIQALERIEFNPPPPILPLEQDFIHLKKFGMLRRSEIFEWVKLWRYMLYLKTLRTEGILFDWFASFDFPHAILEIEKQFTHEGEIKGGIYPELDSAHAALKRAKQEMRETLGQLLGNPSLAPYLVDRQIHLSQGEESLLVRGGFNHVLKAHIIGRSATGFFYIVPEKLSKLKERESALLSRIEELEFVICKEISAILHKQLLFLRYINKEFDRFDHYQARLSLARSKNLEFILPSRDSKLILEGFAHPALREPKPISLRFDKSILLITGVNAGGKTMLLKSILSSAFLARYLLPMPILAARSRIGSFKNLAAILEDPQSVKNDISTFAGRMLAFSHLFQERGVLIGVDEIELGTDSDEAASLFKVILENLIERGSKIIITTHHKRLAALMSANPEVELIAALYDEQRERPTFSFLQGTIGKSYAFETAKRYGIPSSIVKNAQELYGEDREKLNDLIEKSATLELELMKKRQELEGEIKAAQAEKRRLHETLELHKQEHREKLSKLDSLYEEAIAAAKEAAKERSSEDIHRKMNNANKILQAIKEEENQKSVQPKASHTFKVGEQIRYRQNYGTILSLSTKEAMVTIDEGIRIRVPLSEIKPAKSQPKAPPRPPKVSLSHTQRANVSLDLHGLRADEAIERLDGFLSDALIAGFDEILVYHGIGTGKLAYAIKEFLKTHPKVRSFEDAPAHAGGFGAKVVKL